MMNASLYISTKKRNKKSVKLVIPNQRDEPTATLFNFEFSDFAPLERERERYWEIIEEK